MLTRKIQLPSALVLCGMTIAVGSALAGEKMEIVRNKVNKNDQYEVMLNDKSVGRLAFFIAYHGTYKQTKGGDLFDGVNEKGQGTAVLLQGNGPISGFNLNEKEGDTFRSEWSGECFSLSGPDGKPAGYCAGGVFVVPGTGTGRFAGLSGGGNFRGHALPNGDYAVEENLVIEK